MNDKKIIRSADISVIILFLLFAGVLTLVLKDNSNELTVNITVGRELVYSKSLSEVKEGYIYTSTELKGVGIYIETDGVEVEYSDCKNQLCVKSGRITEAGQVIVCAPNELIVELQGSQKEMSGLVTGR